MYLFVFQPSCMILDKKRKEKEKKEKKERNWLHDELGFCPNWVFLMILIKSDINLVEKKTI